MKNRLYSKKSLKFAKAMRSNQTDAENILWQNLRGSRLSGIKFKRQVPIGKYIVDFLCAEKKLIIELDGSQHIENIEYDDIRTMYLSNNGYTVIRFFNNDVLKNTETVLNEIYEKFMEL